MATAWQKKFGAAGKACWKELKAGDISGARGAWGNCMKRHGIAKGRRAAPKAHKRRKHARRRSRR